MPTHLSYQDNNSIRPLDLQKTLIIFYNHLWLAAAKHGLPHKTMAKCGGT
jgi:hypothetical protein